MLGPVQAFCVTGREDACEWIGKARRQVWLLRHHHELQSRLRKDPHARLYTSAFIFSSFEEKFITDKLLRL